MPGGAITVKVRLAVPPPVVRLTLPLAAAVAGTRTTRLVAVLLRMLPRALAPLMVRAVGLPRLVPVRVMLWPSPPGLGATAVMVGGGITVNTPAADTENGVDTTLTKPALLVVRVAPTATPFSSTVIPWS